MRGLDAESKDEKVDRAKVKEKVGIGTRLKLLRNKMKLGPHHKMERFSIMLLGTVVMLVLFTGASFASNKSTVATRAVEQALYTESSVFSLSGQKLNVVGIYGDEAKTDVMLLFQMVDIKGVSTNADNYELFVSNGKKSMKSPPNISFSMFGSTGYGTIRFQDPEGVTQEILDVTIRSNTTLTSNGLGSSGDDGKDASFEEFDQARVVVNPGAKDVTILESLKAGEEDPIKLYTSLVAETIDAEIHEEIDVVVKSLGELLVRENEYANRLISAGYIAPTSPWFIRGDFIDEDGKFNPAQNVGRTHKLKYHDVTIRDGYINQVMSDMSKFDEYMTKHSDESVRGMNGKEEAESERVEKLDILKHEDGSELVLALVSSENSPSSQVSAKDSVAALSDVWSTYLRDKTLLQRQLTHRLIILDADVQSQESSYTVRDDEDLVSFY